MPALIRGSQAIARLVIAWLLSIGTAQACTTGGTTANLGSVSSYAIATTAQQGSGSAGLSCNVTLAALTSHYIRLRVDGSTFHLVGPSGATIAYTASITPNGTPLTVGSTTNLSSLSVVTLFSGTNSSIPIYLRTASVAALPAGTYTGFIDLRWYYSVCSVGAVACLSYSNSPGLVRPALGPPSNWGSGVAVRVNVQLVVENDCIITAPTASFGTSPLASTFNPITRTILIRCSAGAAYSVGLDNGLNVANGARRMASQSDYLGYEIYKTSNSSERWGATGSARRQSSGAESNPGIYDSTTQQGYTYRAEILPGQSAPPGDYIDTIRIDIEF